MNDPPDRETIPTRRRRKLVPERAQAFPYLIEMTGVEKGRRHQLFEGLAVLGRSREEADVYIQDDGISRKHAEVKVEADGTVSVRDRGSTNGTLRNGQPVGETPLELRDGDKLQLGNDVLLEFRFQSALTANFQEEMYSSAVRDPMTEVYNKGYLLDRLDSEFAFAVRHDAPLALIVIDVDHFKRINDTHGHAAGDEVLKTLCRVVESATRLEDVFARYGGEEFVLLMRDQGLAAAMHTAERLRRAIAQHPFEFEGRRIPVTASLGVALTSQGSFASGKELFASADERLYEAKRSGRDRVCGPGGAE